MEAKDVIASAIAIVALLVSIASLLYTRYQVHRAQLSERGTLLKELYGKFFSDDDIQYAYSILEAEKSISFPTFGADNANETKRRQRAFESLLAHLEIICALYMNHLLAPEDMRHFNYNIQRLCQHPGFQSYRQFLEKEWPRSKNLERGPYSSFFWYIDTAQFGRLKIPGSAA